MIGIPFRPNPAIIAKSISSPQILLLKRSDRLIGLTSSAKTCRKNINTGMIMVAARNPLGFPIRWSI